MYLQIVKFEYKGDKVLFSATSKNLEKLGWKAGTGNTPSAYLTGLMLGTKVKDKVKEVIPDFELNSSIKGSRIYASLKGVIDSGLKVPCSEEIFPGEDRINGKSISDFGGLGA